MHLSSTATTAAADVPQTEEEASSIAAAPAMIFTNANMNTYNILPSPISKIAQIAVNDREESFKLRQNGDPGTRVRAPWQSQKKQYNKTPNAIVVGGLDAVFRMTNQAVVNIDNIREGSGHVLPTDQKLPPDVVLNPTTKSMVAMPHLRKKSTFDTFVSVATQESQSIASPRIVELDSRIANPLSGRKCFRKEDSARHASGGWAVALDYRDGQQQPWSTTSQNPEMSYRPVATHRNGRKSFRNDTTSGRVILEATPPPKGKGGHYENSVVNSPRLAYQKRVREMNNSLQNWEVQQTVSRTNTSSANSQPK